MDRKRNVVGLVIGLAMIGCSPRAEAPRASPASAADRLLMAVEAELETDRPWSVEGDARELVFGGVAYRVLAINSDVAELRAVLPPTRNDAQIGRAVQVVLAAGAGQHDAGIDLVEISGSVSRREPTPSRVINGVEIWQEGNAIVARPVTAP